MIVQIAVQLNPGDEKLHRDYASFLQKHRKDYNSARLHYMTALQINPDNPQTHYALSDLYAHGFNDATKADEHLKIAESLLTHTN